MSQLNNILVRIEKAAEIINLDPQILDKLQGFKARPWACDIEAEMDNLKVRHFRTMVVLHRSPHTDQPHKGGLRYYPYEDFGVMEDMLLSHAVEMSFKAWLVNINWGGAKSGIAVDPSKHSERELKKITEAWVKETDERNILGLFRYVPAPDVGTSPKIMNWIRQRYAERRRQYEEVKFAGVVTGKPVGDGFFGIPGRTEATGYGLLAVLQNFRKANQKKLAIQGFGNVGSHVAKFAKKFGLEVVAVSDVNGGVYNPKGLDIITLAKYYEGNKTLSGFPGSENITNQELLELPCDILVPAALEHVITQENAHEIKAQIVLEGANGPTTPEADEILKDNGVLVIPDILANAGGVTVSFFEWARNVNIRDERVPRANIDDVLKAMSKMLTNSAQEVIKTAKKHKVSLRQGAYILAIERIEPIFKSKHLT